MNWQTQAWHTDTHNVVIIAQRHSTHSLSHTNVQLKSFLTNLTYIYTWLSLAFTSAENMQGFVKASNAYIDIEQKEKHPEAKDTEEF